MEVQKAGTVLINLETKKICLVYRPRLKDYSFPKGHLEAGETLAECAVRETEEETMRANHLVSNQEIGVIRYTTPRGEEAVNYMYLAIDDGPTTKEIAEIDKEEFHWFPIEEVYDILTYDNLKEFWESVKGQIIEIFENGKA